MSDLAAKVTVSVRSRVVRCSVETLSLASRQSAEIELTVRPTAVEPDFQRQVVVANANNAMDVHTVTVRSNNIEVQGSVLHSLFYRLTLPDHQPALSFDDVPLNSPRLRTITIKNITSSALTLEVHPSRDDIVVYMRPRRNLPLHAQTNALPAHDGPPERERLGYLDLAQPGPARGAAETDPLATELSRQGSEAGVAPSPFSATPLLASALTAEAPRASVVSPMLAGADAARRPATAAGVSVAAVAPAVSTFASLEELADMFSHDDMPGAGAGSTGAGEAVADLIQWRLRRARSLEHILASGQLVPTQTVVLPPETKCKLYLVFTPRAHPDLSAPFVDATAGRGVDADGLLDDSEGSTRKQKWDGALSIRMVAYDARLLPPGAAPGVRHVELHARLCRSLLFVSQRHIHLGRLRSGETRTRSLVVKNLSELPLLYRIRTSGSVDSATLHFMEGQTGLVRPYGWREVMFSVRAVLSGTLLETVWIENVNDPSNTASVIFKATVRRPPAFELPRATIDFGALVPGAATAPQTVMINNVSNAPRVFRIALDAQAATFRASRLVVMLKSTGVGTALLAPDVLQRITVLEQKIRIQQRKSNKEKVCFLLSFAVALCFVFSIHHSTG